MKENRMVQAHHHPDPLIILLIGIDRCAVLLPLLILLPRNLLQILPHLRLLLRTTREAGQRALDVLPRRKPRQVVHPAHRPDEIRVRHVRQRAQVRLMVVARLVRAGAGGELRDADVRWAVGDPAAGAEPLTELLCLRGSGGGDLAADGLEGGVEGVLAQADGAWGARVAVRWGWTVGGHGDVVADLFGSAGPFAHEGHGGCEDDPALLAGLHSAGDEGFAVADALDVVEDRDAGVAS